MVLSMSSSGASWPAPRRGLLGSIAERPFEEFEKGMESLEDGGRFCGCGLLAGPGAPLGFLAGSSAEMFWPGGNASLSGCSEFFGKE